MNAVKGKELKLTYVVRNVFTITRYSGYDPEVNMGSSFENRLINGVDYSSYPTATSHSLSLSYKF